MSIRNPPPKTAEASRLIETVKMEFERLESVLNGLIPHSGPGQRERALALTNLEQSSMWATKAILEAQS